MPMIRPSATRMNPPKASATLLIALFVALLAGCIAPPMAPPPAPPPTAAPVSPDAAKPVGLPNPATVACNCRSSTLRSVMRGALHPPNVEPTAASAVCAACLPARSAINGRSFGASVDRARLTVARVRDRIEPCRMQRMMEPPR